MPCTLPLLVAVAHAAGGPPDPALDPALGGPTSAALEVGGVVGEEPPFGPTARDVGWVGLRARYRPAEALAVDVGWRWNRMWWPDGWTRSGPGDVELGTSLRLGPAPEGPRPGAWASWSVKLPNATERFEEEGTWSSDHPMGTDETDVTLRLHLAWRMGPLVASLAGGVAILGDPWHRADQDDAPVIETGLAWSWPGAWASTRLGGRLASPANPSALAWALGGGWRHPAGPWVGVEASLGLTQPAGDVGAVLRLGWRDASGGLAD